MRQCQHRDNSAMTLAILFSSKTVESLKDGVATCCDMDQSDTIGKIELIPLSVLSSVITNYKNDIQ